MQFKNLLSASCFTMLLSISCDAPLDDDVDDVAADVPLGKGDSIFGQGKRLENRIAGLEPLLGADALEVVVDLELPPGNVAAGPDGRTFFTFHPEGNKGNIQVAELVGHEVRAYPDQDFQGSLDSVLSVRVAHGRLWMLDYGNFGLSRPRLLAVDLATDELAFEYEFSHSEAPLGSMLNDFQVAPDGSAVFISDLSTLRRRQAIVVVHLAGSDSFAERRLEEHPSVDNGPFDVFVDDTLVRAFGIAPSYGVDAIAIDNTGDFLYYAAINAGELFRVNAPDLLLGGAVEVQKVADTTLTDGIAVDAEDRVYLTDMEHSAIVRVDTDGALELLIQDERLRWPDGLSWTSSGSLLITASALHQILPEIHRSQEDIARNAPYQIFRLRLSEA